MEHVTGYKIDALYAMSPETGSLCKWNHFVCSIRSWMLPNDIWDIYDPHDVDALRLLRSAYFTVCSTACSISSHLCDLPLRLHTQHMQFK